MEKEISLRITSSEKYIYCKLCEFKTRRWFNVKGVKRRSGKLKSGRVVIERHYLEIHKKEYNLILNTMKDIE